MLEIKDKQREAFDSLIEQSIPALLKEKSFIYEDRYSVDFSMYPVDTSNVTDNRKTGSVYTTIKTVCAITDTVTSEKQEFIIDLLNLPIYQELGFKVGGNYKQVLGLYERPAGWTFLRKNSKSSGLLISVTIQSKGGRKWIFKNTSNNLPIVSTTRTRNGKEDLVQLSISTFFRAITGYSNEELLEIFGYDNPVNLLAFNDSDNAIVEVKGSANKDLHVSNRNDCIEILASVMFGREKVRTSGNTIASLQADINNQLFNSSYFNLGEGSSTQLEFKQSFKNRATNKILAEEVILKDEVIAEGTILSAEILEKIDSSPVDIIKVLYNGKTHTLHKFSFFSFRALGYYLAEELTIGNISFKKGQKLSLDVLRELNATNLSEIKVTSSRDGGTVQIFNRRTDGSTLAIEDLFTAYSIFANNLNGFDTFDKEYELTNRVIIPFDKKAINIIERHVNKIISKIKEGIQYIEFSVETEDDRLPLLDLSEKFKFDYNLDTLLVEIARVDDGESQMADINNVMSFLSKSYKITANVPDASVSDDLIRIQDTQVGRLDLYDAPESKKIGRVHYKTLLTKVNQNGYLLTPFFRVNNGVVSDEVVWITAAEEENTYVAEWNETFKEEDGSPKKKIYARYNGEVVIVDVASVTLREYSFLQNVGPTTSCIPFIDHSAGKRITMSDNQQKQATPTVKAKRAIVNTGAESFLGIGKYTALDIITTFYNNVIVKCPQLQEFEGEIKSSKIRLYNISSANNGDRVYYFTIDKIEELKKQDTNLQILSLAQIQVPFNYRTSDSGVFTYKINTNKSSYSGNDIVLYSSDYDITEYNLDLMTDFGGQQFDNDVFKSGTALGRDYLIAYKTYEGSTIDDAITVNNDLIADDTITSILLLSVEETLYNDDRKSERFQSGPKSPSYFDTNGLPKLGTYLNPGDAVIMKLVEQHDVKTHKNSKRYKATRLNVHTTGQVISAQIHDNNGRETATVILAFRADGCVGDKMAGRYGNKGVIAKIVPAEFMPYDPQTGLTIDIILDPEGIPSRMNISQLLEGVTGLACRKLNKHTVISQFNPKANDYIRDLANKTDTHPMMLIDGRSGKYFERPVNVVSLYMYKLVHMARKKIHSIGMQSGLDTITLQPKRGGKANGGQKFGEMESWCLEGIGAYKILQELQSTLSDDITSKDNVRRIMSDNFGDIEFTGTNSNDLMMQALVRSMCAEIVTKSDESGDFCYEFKPLTSDEIRSLAPSSIKTEQALHSIDSFGSIDNPAKKAESKAKWGYIDLNTEMVSPLWIEKGSLHKLFLIKTNQTYNLCGTNFFRELIEGKQFVKVHSNMRYLPVLTSKEIEKISVEESAEYSTGFNALLEILKNYDVQGSYELLCAKIDRYERTQIIGKKEEHELTAQDFLLSQIGDAPSQEEDEVIDASDYATKTNLQMIQVARFMKDFIDRKASLLDYIVTAYPVMSQVFRPQIKMPGVNAKADFDHYYCQILNAVKNIEIDKNERTMLELYEALAQFMGFRKTASKYINLSEWFLGIDRDSSHGKIRESVQSKVILRSGRAVIVPAADTEMDAMHIGIPITAAVVTWEEQLISYLESKRKDDGEIKLKAQQWKSVLYAIANRSFNMFKKVYNDDFKGAFLMGGIAAYNAFYRYIREYLEGNDNEDPESYLPPQIVIAGRQPSLHQFSVRGYYVRIVNDRAIHVNPLVCKGYNADFDGDQMWYAAPISYSAKEEAIQKLSAASNMINPKNSSIVLELSQDIALGIYCATMLQNNKEELTDKEKNTVPLCYNDIESLKLDLFNRVIPTYEIVSLRYNNKLFLSTAGRIVFNSLLPNGLRGINDDGSRRVFRNVLGINVGKPDRFTDLQFDGLITAGEGLSKQLSTLSLHDICKTIYNELDDENSLHIEMVKVCQELAKFGFTFADLFGISISLDDLDNIANNSNKQSYLNEMNAIQSQIEEDYQMGLFSDEDKHSAIEKLSKQTMDFIQKDLISSMDRDNNIFIMFDSGARGSKGQIAQTCGAIGILDKTESQTLVTPITSNYHEGMSSFDVQMMSYSARAGMSSTQNKTADAGYATRQSIYMTAGLKIIEWDCGKENWWFDVMWDELIPEYSKLKPSYTFFKNNLLGKKVWSASKESVELFGDTLDNLTITEDSFKCLSNGFHSVVLEGSGKGVEVDPKDVKKFYGYKILDYYPKDDKVYEFVDDSFIQNSSKLSYLEVVKPEEIVISTNSILGATIIDDIDAEREFSKFLENGKISKKCIPLVSKKHILSINTDMGTFTFRYKMTEACRSLLEKREARNLKGLQMIRDSEHLNDYTFIISNETLDWIEEEGLARIEARILLDCQSGRDESVHGQASHGCCARCYGLKYTNNRYPKVGEIIGIESAQAVGEPAAQLTLSLVNKGGAAGESVASGVEIFQRLLGGSVPSEKENNTLVTNNSGYLHIDNLDDASIIKVIPEDKDCLICKKCLKANNDSCPNEQGANGMCLVNNKVLTTRLLYESGTYIKAGEAITDGYVLPNDITHVDPDSLEVLIRKKQIVWLLNYFNTFKENNIYINARHFEIFARLQNFMVLVIKSDNPDFQVGRLYEYSEIIGHEDELMVVAHTSKQKEVIIQNSGALTALAFENVPDVLAGFVTQGVRSYRNSPIGSLNIGENLVSNEKKELRTPNMYNWSMRSKIDSAFGTGKFSFSEEEIQKRDLELNLDDMDLDAIFSVDSSLDEVIADDVINANTETQEISEDTVDVSMQDMDLFGNSSNNDELEKPEIYEEKSYNIMKSEEEEETDLDDDFFDVFDEDDTEVEEAAKISDSKPNVEVATKNTEISNMSIF